MRQHQETFVFLAAIFFFSTISLCALTIDEIVRLKGTGIDDRTIQWLLEQRTYGLGVKEVERPDGSKDKIYYSVSTPEEDSKAQAEERQKLERSWEILRNRIIDDRIE